MKLFGFVIIMWSQSKATRWRGRKSICDNALNDPLLLHLECKKLEDVKQNKVN